MAEYLPGSGLRFRPQPPMMGQGINPASQGGGLQYRPPGMNPLQSLAGGGLKGLAQALMAWGSGRPELAGQAFSGGVQAFDNTQRQNQADYRDQFAFDLGMEDRATEKADKESEKAARAAEKAAFDAAVDALPIDDSEKQAIKAGVTKYEKPKPTERKTSVIAGRLVDDVTGELIKDYSAEEAALRQASRPITNVTNTITGDSPSDAKLRTKLSEKEGERWSALKEQGVISAGLGQDFQVIDELLTVAPQGPIAGNLAAAFPGFSSAGDAFQSIVVRVAPSLRTPGSGATSDIEYEGMLKSLPRLGNTPDGNKVIAEIMKAKAALNVERSQIVTAYENEEITAKQARAALAEIDKRSIMSPELRKSLGVIGVDTGGPKVVKELPAGFE
jgi:hypothetical protein